MITYNHQKTALLLFIGTFLFACSTYISSYTIPQLLLGKGLTVVEVDHIEVIEMLGYVIAGLILASIINKIHFNKATIICLVILIICTFNIMILEGYEVLKINFIIMSSAYYAYFIITIIRILEALNDNRYYAIITFVMVWSLGHFIADILKDLFNSYLDSLILCILFYSTIIVTCLYKVTIHRVLSTTPKFSFLISNIALQILTGFIITYITVDILWFYEGFASVKKLALSDIDTVLHYMLTSIFFTTIPVMLILKKVNKYLVNLLLIVILMASFILISIYGTNFVANISFICLISICLSSLCICNILILCDKFELHDLRFAIIIYFTMCAIGMVAGAISSNSVYNSIDQEDNFLFSTTAVVGTFILYYLWYFIRRKLYRC